MKIAYTYHARAQTWERDITRSEINKALINGSKSHGKGNKTLLTDTSQNICVVVVNEHRNRLVVITAYRI